MLAFLEYEGKVDVNKPVSHYLPELKGSEWDTVKVVEALDMATGLNGTEHDEAEQNSRTDPDQVWYRWAATDAVGIVADVRKRGETWVDVLKAMKRKTPGHEKFEYNRITSYNVCYTKLLRQGPGTCRCGQGLCRGVQRRLLDGLLRCSQHPLGHGRPSCDDRSGTAAH